jgi:hypothetical protein
LDKVEYTLREAERLVIRGFRGGGFAVVSALQAYGLAASGVVPMVDASLMVDASVMGIVR